MIKRLIISEAILECIKESEKGYLYGILHPEEGVVHVIYASEKDDGKSRYERIGSWGYGETQGIILNPRTMEAFVSENGKHVQLHVDVIRFKTDIFARVKGIFDTDILSKKKAAILGCGSVGSLVALELAKAGLGSFLLIDPDNFSVNNICRHIGDIEDLGRYKTRVVKDRIIRRNPSADVITIEKDILQMDRERLKGLLSDCDLLVASTDSKDANLYLNELSLELVKPLIWIGLYERASWGHIIYSIPGETPCPACVAPAVSEIMEMSPKEERIIDYSAVKDITQIKAEPGLGVDVAFVTIAGAKIALAILLKKNESSSFSNFLPPERTLFIVANTPGAIFKGTRPLTTSWVETKIRDDCDYCQKDRYLREYGLSEDELRNSVKRLVEEIPLIEEDKDESKDYWKKD